MAFLNREKILPEVMQPYGPYEDVRGQLDQSYDTAQNRASQRINQMYANVGMNPRGAPATAARARSATDLENQRAQLGYQSYYDWLRGKQLAYPQIQPSGASTIAAPFVSGIGQALGPSVVGAASKGLGTAWDWATGGGAASAYAPNISSMTYTAGAPSYGEGGYGEYAPADAFSYLSPTDFAGYGDYGAYADIADVLGGFI